jgi:hypothetical protein
MRLTQVTVEGDHSVSEGLSFCRDKNNPEWRECIMENPVADAEMLQPGWLTFRE